MTTTPDVSTPAEPPRALRILSPRPWVGLAAAALLAGCGASDEAQTGASGDSTRTELVYVDGRKRQQTVAGTAGERQARPPAEPTVSDRQPVSAPPDEDQEAGGDDLLAYDPEGVYTVQVGTFDDAAQARRQVQRLVALGYPAYTIAHPSGRPIRIRIGYFAARDQADRFGRRFVRDHGGQYWIDRRADEGGKRR